MIKRQNDFVESGLLEVDDDDDDDEEEEEEEQEKDVTADANSKLGVAADENVPEAAHEAKETMEPLAYTLENEQTHNEEDKIVLNTVASAALDLSLSEKVAENEEDVTADTHSTLEVADDETALEAAHEAKDTHGFNAELDLSFSEEEEVDIAYVVEEDETHSAAQDIAAIDKKEDYVVVDDTESKIHVADDTEDRVESMIKRQNDFVESGLLEDDKEGREDNPIHVSKKVPFVRNAQVCLNETGKTTYMNEEEGEISPRDCAQEASDIRGYIRAHLRRLSQTRKTSRVLRKPSQPSELKRIMRQHRKKMKKYAQKKPYAFKRWTSDLSLGTRARRAAPNKTQLRLYEEGVRRQKRKNATDSPRTIKARKISPNKTQLRLYEEGVRRLKLKSATESPCTTIKARKISPNKTQLRLYEDGVRRLKLKNATESPCTTIKARKISPNKTQLRLYEDGVRRLKLANGLI